MTTHAKPSDKSVDGDFDLVVRLPVLSDETALLIYDLLESACEKFSDRYARQIQRARRVRKREELRRRRERQSLTAQQALPID
jgi:hypothetical protein